MLLNDKSTQFRPVSLSHTMRKSTCRLDCCSKRGEEMFQGDFLPSYCSENVVKSKKHVSSVIVNRQHFN